MDPNALRLELIERITRLPVEKLTQVADFVRQLHRHRKPELSPQASGNGSYRDTLSKDWPHAPLHRLTEQGTYMVTTGTLHKEHVFGTAERLTLLENSLLSLANKYEWHLEAWAVFSNHYHFVGHTMSEPSRLRTFLTDLHASSARDVNRLDGKSGRQVWHNFWDKQLTYEKSYLARLNYVHQNAVKHGLVTVANQYR